MNIDRLLEAITLLTWTTLGIISIIIFVITARRRGPTEALRNMFSVRAVFPLLIAIGLTILSASLVFVPPQEVGVVISILSPKGVRDQPLTSGLRFVVPLAERVETYPIYWQTYTMSSKPLEGQRVGDDSIVARTKDGQEVALDCSVIFRIERNQVVRVHIDWQHRYIEDLMRPRMRGIVRTLVSKYTVSEVNSFERTNLENELDSTLRTILEDKGFILDSFVLRNIAFSLEYAASVEEKQVAEQREEQRRHEAEQIRNLARGKADAVKIQAEAEATAMVVRASAAAEARVIEAEAEAAALQLIQQEIKGNPELLTYRYIHKISPNVRVMLLPNDGPFILPLPNLSDGSEEVLTPTRPDVFDDRAVDTFSTPMPPVTSSTTVTTALNNISEGIVEPETP